jgi:hypothetical protein
MIVSRLITMPSLANTILLAVITLTLGCRGDNPMVIGKSARPGSRIFEGFAYSGEQLTSKRQASHVSSLSPFPLATEGLPTRLISGRDYIFHHTLPVNSTDLAQQVLAPRLRAEGFVLKETQNGIFFKGIGHLDLNSSGSVELWEIQFRRDGCEGAIAHGLDCALVQSPWPWIRHTWEAADYILTVEGSCDL